MAETMQKWFATEVLGGLWPYVRVLATRVHTGWRHVRFFGRRRYCPVCRKHASAFLPFGVIPRALAQCPFCGALERHRLMWLFFQRKTGLFTQPRKKMLHIAPEAAYVAQFVKSPVIDYLTGDFAEGRAMVQMDITDIRYPDDTFDVIYCSHVLEHVIEDRKAMVELRRVLKPDGWAVLQVPIYADPTFEDASITDPIERERVFGQWDHVRRYGPDYVQRLQDAGFGVRVYLAEEIADDSEIDKMAIWREERIHFCRKS